MCENVYTDGCGRLESRDLNCEEDGSDIRTVVEDMGSRYGVAWTSSSSSSPS